jgi:hypothetical protein
LHYLIAAPAGAQHCFHYAHQFAKAATAVFYFRQLLMYRRCKGRCSSHHCRIFHQRLISRVGTHPLFTERAFHSHAPDPAPAIECYVAHRATVGSAFLFCHTISFLIKGKLPVRQHGKKPVARFASHCITLHHFARFASLCIILHTFKRETHQPKPSAGPGCRLVRASIGRERF